MNQTATDYHIPPGVTEDQVDTIVVVPFVPGMLREQTMQALHDSGMAYLTVPLRPGNEYEYAAAFRLWWNLPFDLIILEQDMVPAPGQLRFLAVHEGEWVSAGYHCGNGQYATGLGFCKIARTLRERHPNAGFNATADPRDPRELIGWMSLNENVERHLTRLGERQTVLGFTVEHLHHPEPARVD